jgi:hypothetical protein
MPRPSSHISSTKDPISGQEVLLASPHCFRFNGQEKNNEIQDESNCMNFKFIISDARLGRFLSVDPIFKDYPWNSPFAFAENDVIRAVDLEGLEKYFINQRYNSVGQLTQISILTFRIESGELENTNLLHDNEDICKYEVGTIHTYENGEEFMPPTFSDELTNIQATTLTGEFQTYFETISQQHSVISDHRSIQGRTTTAATKVIHVPKLNRIDYFLDDEDGDKKHLESASILATNKPEYSFVKLLNSSHQILERAKALLKSNEVNDNQYTDEPIQSSKSNKARVDVGVLQQQH